MRGSPHSRNNVFRGEQQRARPPHSNEQTTVRPSAAAADGPAAIAVVVERVRQQLLGWPNAPSSALICSIHHGGTGTGDPPPHPVRRTTDRGALLRRDTVSRNGQCSTSTPASTAAQASALALGAPPAHAPKPTALSAPNARPALPCPPLAARASDLGDHITSTDTSALRRARLTTIGVAEPCHAHFAQSCGKGEGAKRDCWRSHRRTPDGGRNSPPTRAAGARAGRQSDSQRACTCQPTSRICLSVLVVSCGLCARRKHATTPGGKVTCTITIPSKGVAVERAISQRRCGHQRTLHRLLGPQ